jgi:uroporphyrinogen decarboxylase
LTMEVLGRVHPNNRTYHNWIQMTETERILHRKDIADLHIASAEHFNQHGFLYHVPKGWEESDLMQSLEHVREISEMEYFVSLHGDATYAIPNGDDMMDFVIALHDNPDKLKDEAQKNVDLALKKAEEIKKWGTVDGFCLCSDYCSNDNSFMSPKMFDTFVTPYLKQLIAGYKEMGFYVIKHTDGNIMPILDSLISTEPHALHSIDPQGGVDIAEVKRRVKGKNICLIGNINCNLLQMGTDEEVIDECRYALKHGMVDYGYIYSTSNCIYSGMPLERYHLMLDIWKKEGNYA